MKVKDWPKAAQLLCERQNQAATTDTSELNSFLLSELPVGLRELPVGQSGPPVVIHRPHVPLSTSMPVHVPSDNQQNTEATQDELSFQQVIPNILQQSLYSSLVTMDHHLTQPYHSLYLSPEESLAT